MPKRIQLRRTKGWKKPEGAIVCSRPSFWGNRFIGSSSHSVWAFRSWLEHPHETCRGIVEWMRFYREVSEGDIRLHPRANPEETAREFLRRLPELRGRHLLCWCPLSKPCHVDPILEFANK